MIHKIWKVIKEVEAKLQIDFKVDQIEYTEDLFSRHTGMFYTDDNDQTVIRIGPGLTGRKFREVIYHELGHSLMWGYKIPKHLLKVFINDPFSLNVADTDWKYQFVTYGFVLRTVSDVHENFVSHYARVNFEEDVCESFSYFASGRSLKRLSEVARAKIFAIERLLEYLKKKQ